MTEKITIIAEAGVNHNGKINLAYKLIDIAASSKADFVKFQITNADLITKKAKKAKYQINQNKSETQQEMVKKLEMDWETVNPLLMNYAKKRKIKFLTTAFDINGLNHLKKLKFKSYKVPSGEIINHPYLKHLAGFGSNIIMSTGMATMKEIDDAVSILINNGTKLKNITLMQCNTAYPTPFNDVNLRAMETMKNTFGTKVGYSDHTIGIEAAIAAAASDDNIDGIAVGGCVGLANETILKRGTTGYNDIPSLLKWFDQDVMISLISPRPCIIVAGISDHIWPYKFNLNQ